MAQEDDLFSNMSRAELEELLRRTLGKAKPKGPTHGITDKKTGIYVKGFRGGYSAFLSWDELDYVVAHINELVALKP